MDYHILEARYVGQHVIWLRFRDGTTARSTWPPLCTAPVFEPLLDPVFFRTFTVHPEFHTSVWPNRRRTLRRNFFTRMCASPPRRPHKNSPRRWVLARVYTATRRNFLHEAIRVVLLLFSTLLTAAPNDKPLLLRHPTISRTQIVFSLRRRPVERPPRRWRCHAADHRRRRGKRTRLFARRIADRFHRRVRRQHRRVRDARRRAARPSA